jgi:hypothetical protein
MLDKLNTPARAAPSAAEAFCDANGLTEHLPEALATQADGQRFEPVQIRLDQDPTLLPDSLALLHRTRPVGGYARLIRDNQQRLLSNVLQQLDERIAEYDRTGESAVFLRDLHHQVQQRQEQLQRRAEDLDAEYEHTRATVKDWQEHQAERGGVLRKMLAWGFGSDTRLSLPEVMAAWNKREHLALDRASVAAAIEICSRLSERISSILAVRTAVALIARRCAEQAAQQFHLLAEVDDEQLPWTWRSDPATLAGHLAPRANLDALAAQILTRLSPEVEHAALRTQAAELAQAESERLLDGLTMVQLIEAEAGTISADEELDPVVLVGRSLLEQLDTQAGWRLARHARPRQETVQITADGSPLFRLDGLRSAAYGDDVDRFGFVQVELEVAIEDLALIRDSSERFAQAQAERNFYVLDALAESWDERQEAESPPSEAPVEPAQPWNGAETSLPEVAS